VADKVNRAKGPVEVLVPLGGFSDYDRPGQPFHDPNANSAFIESLDVGLNSNRAARVEAHINDRSFAALAVQHLLALVGRAAHGHQD
jgi:uncharacterized protein (UPF0261 family)